MFQAATTGNNSMSQGRVLRVPLVIRTVADLKLVLNSPRATKRLPRNGVRVAIPTLDEQARREFEVKLNRYIHACGCGAGGATFLIATALLAAYAIAIGRRTDWIELAATVSLGFVAVIAVTIAAKLIALKAARLRFAMCCSRLIRLLEKHSSRA